MRCQRLSSVWKVLASALFAIALMAPAPSQADTIGSEDNIGIGLGTGTFTSGLTGKFYLDKKSAIQLHVGNFGTWGNYYCGFACGFGLSADYIYEFQDLVNESAGRLFLGAGGGAYFASYDAYGRYGRYAGSFGLHGVFELGWHFSEFPLEIVIDIRPVFDFTPGFIDNFFGLTGGASIRFFF